MKNKFIILLFGITLFSCSSDDNSGGLDNNNSSDYLPQEQGNYWVYDVNSGYFSGRDSLYIAGTTSSAGNTYQTYLTSDIPYGFYSGLMSSGQSRTSGSKMFINGSFSFGDILGIELGSNINLDDFVIFDNNTVQGTILDTESGSFNVPYSDEVDLLVEYTLSSKTGQSYSNYSLSSGDSYEDVRSTEIVISAKITANTEVFGFPISLPILDTQNVVSSTQYYAKNVGVVNVNTTVQYQLNEIPDTGFELPILQSFSNNITEVLDIYFIN